MIGPTTLSLIQTLNGCAAWRVIYPAYALAAQGYPVAWGYNGEEATSRQIEFAQLVVLQRSCWLPGDEARGLLFRDWLHQGGRALGYETDDDLYSPEIIERLRQTGDQQIMAKSTPELEAERQARIFALGLADGVTVSTPGLARVVMQHTQAPVLVVPNAIDLARFTKAITDGPQRPAGYPITIGWLGGNRPDRDVELTGLATAWGKIAARYPDVRFVVGGYPLGALLKAVPQHQLQYIDKVPLARYPQLYNLVDIGCCPLANETFNRSKSPIKALEYGAAGAAVVASPLVYSDVIEHGQTGLIAHDAEDWEEALVWLIEHDGLREYLIERLFGQVSREHSLETTLDRWPRAWGQIVQASQKTPTAGSGAVRAASDRPRRDPISAPTGGHDAE